MVDRAEARSAHKRLKSGKTQAESRINACSRHLPDNFSRPGVVVFSFGLVTQVFAMGLPLSTSPSLILVRRDVVGTEYCL
jgi:hypothetical protein